MSKRIVRLSAYADIPVYDDVPWVRISPHRTGEKMEPVFGLHFGAEGCMFLDRQALVALRDEITEALEANPPREANAPAGQQDAISPDCPNQKGNPA